MNAVSGSALLEAAELIRTFVRTAASRARLVGFAVAAALVVVVAWRVGSSVTVNPLQRAADLADVAGLSFLAPVAALVFGTAVLGDPADDSTLVYFWLRPVRRITLSISACLAALVLAVPAAVIPAALVQMVLPGNSLIFRGVIATTLAVIAYTVLFVLLGLVTNRSLVWGIAYLLIVEQFIARGGSALGSLSIRAYAMSIMSASPRVESPVAYFSTSTSVVVLVVIAAIVPVAVAWRLHRAEVA